ncbi:MAG TPA: Nudix family hydrolase [Rhodocyclaceae bacterium]|nr:Nudix family hydrolase [Rhodocyclaceae bacterium]
MNARKQVEVAAAVIERPDGSFLLGRRPPNGIYSGWWEFPGGKVEAGETAHQALVRELHEELGITVLQAYPWITREHVYEHAHVRLHFFRVTQWSGELLDLQHDKLSWQKADEVVVSPVLPANAPVFAGLRIPKVYGITYASEIGIVAQLQQLNVALAHGLRLVQLREAALPDSMRERFVTEAIKMCHLHGAKVLVNGDVELARHARADGVHFSATQLMALQSRPGFNLVAASCHTEAELAKAAELELDFVAVGTVLPTKSHPDRPALGWERFAQLIANYPVPVFALGGLPADALETARQHGAHGIAAIRSVWTV